jgi:pimeloyl-ACP methyl ester carboxylesterase
MLNEQSWGTGRGVRTACATVVTWATLVLGGVGGVEAQDGARGGTLTPSGLWYSVRGSGDAVVLIHGSNLDSRSLSALSNALAADHRVVELDLRFHGQSKDGEGQFSFQEDVRDVMDAAGIGRATIIGHSLGGQVAVDLALLAPQRVSRLVLVAPGLSGRAAMRRQEGMEPMIAALRARDFTGAAEALARLPVMTLYRDTSGQSRVRAMVRDNARLFAADPRRMRATGGPGAARLGELAIPVLVVMGGADPTESSDVGREVVAGVRGARGDTLAGCGHLVPFDCPADLARVVREFLVVRTSPR